MASQTEIVNMALTLLGESRITSMDDDIKPAREARAIYNLCLEALLGNYNWSFAKARASLPALAEAPEHGYALKFQIPSDAVRITFVGDYYVGVDLSDYRSAPAMEFQIEGREILTNMSAPLHIKYIRRLSDASLFSPSFTMAFAARLAEVLAEPLTQSDQKRARAEAEFNKAIKLAVRSNAIEMPPEKFPDDEWLLSRL